MRTTKPKVILFDVNETLLDITPVKQRIGDLLVDTAAPDLWFSMMLHYSLVMSTSGQYASFTDIGSAALQMLARNFDVNLSFEDAKTELAMMARLQPHSDVVDALTRLQKGGWRMAILTNSSQAGAQAQMAHAGLEGFFERQLSVESVSKYKPDPAVYHWAVQEMQVSADECMLVAAHGWDVAGAKWAGLQTAFVARPGQQKFPLGPAPDLDASDIGTFADAMGA